MDGIDKKPEIYFTGFTDAWEQRQLGDVSEIMSGGTPSTQIENYWVPKEIPWLSSGEVHKKRITYTDNMISRLGLENSKRRTPIISFTKNPLENSNLLGELFTMISRKLVIELHYHTFNAPQKVLSINLHPYFLKEYNRRWYIFGAAEEV